MIDKLRAMLSDLSTYKERDKHELLQTYVIERLDKSYNLYNKELQHSLLYLASKHEKSLIKRMK